MATYYILLKNVLVPVVPLRWADTRGHVAATCCSDKKLVWCTLRQHVHTHENVAGTCPRDILQRHVLSCELRGTRRGEKITPKLVLHNHKSISSHEGTCRCNISLGYVPAKFSCTCCDFVPATCARYTTLIHVVPACTTCVFVAATCPRYTTLIHVAPACTTRVFCGCKCPCNMTPRVCHHL